MSQPIEASKFFVDGGALKAGAPSYVSRPADIELEKLILAGEFCYVLTPRQMGKSSLMNRTAQRLEMRGVHAARIDLTGIGTVAAEAWYFDLVNEIARALKLTIDLDRWWPSQSLGGPVQRFVNFLRDVVLQEIETRVVIFIDEIDYTINLDFSDDFFAAIRSIYNARDREPKFDRLSFVLLGVASPSDLIKDPTRTPFNIGRGMALNDFSRSDALVLQEGLDAVFPGEGEVILNRIYHWSGGHPYLTQKLCKVVVHAGKGPWPVEKIDRLVERQFFSKESSKEENLEFVRDRILTNAHSRQLLTIYRKIYQGKEIAEDNRSPIHNQLKLSGLVKTVDGYLQVRNEIYRRVFDLAWVKENVAIDWAPIIAAVAIFVAVLAIAFIVHNSWQTSQVREAERRFYRATTPREKGEQLARILKPPGLWRSQKTDYLAKELFYGLSTENQMAIFTENADAAKTVLLIQELYKTLADTDNSDSSRPLLVAMKNAASRFEDNQKAKDLASEIEAWLAGRDAASEKRYAIAVQEYTKAINLNFGNPAVWYERGKAWAELGQYAYALTDLDQVLALARELSAPTPVPPVAAFTMVVTTRPALPRTSPPASAPTTPGPGLPGAVTPVNILPTLPSVTDVPLPDQPTAELSVTPGAVVVPPPAGPGSNFVTPSQIRAAVSNLINGNPQLASALANPSPAADYSNLMEADLLFTPTATSVSTETPEIIEKTEMTAAPAVTTTSLLTGQTTTQTPLPAPSTQGSPTAAPTTPAVITGTSYPPGAFGGYRLPWAGGETIALAQSVGHDRYTPSGSAHYAFDFFKPGTPAGTFDVYAARGGTVKEAVWRFQDGSGESPGNYIVLEDRSTSPTTYQLYMHLAQDSIPEGLRTPGVPVRQGQFIGIAGNTGISSGNHLLFMVHTNPSSYWGQSVDITFDDVMINGGRPRIESDLPYCQATDVCDGIQNTYVSGNALTPSLWTFPTLRPTVGGVQLKPVIKPTGKVPLDLPTEQAPLVTDAQGVVMALIPAGEFRMGSENGRSDERPVHTVYLDAFYMDIYEVTNALYEKCVQAGACTPPGETGSKSRSSYYGNAEFAAYPVINVNWEQASALCQWRGGRLPSEAEWEKAARGGLEGKLYTWGDEPPDCQRANMWDKESACVGDTSQVGSYAPNGYGLFDMAGNVWEWVEDWYGASYYANSPASNPTGPASGNARVTRGGSWGDNLALNERVASRSRLTAEYRVTIGFRCSRSP